MHVTLSEHVRALRGGSQSRLMRGEDGNYYVVKFQGNPQGTRTLASEWLATRLAQVVGLPVAVPAIVEFDETLFRNSELHFQTPEGSIPICSGLHYGSCYVINPLHGRTFDILPKSFLTELKNKEDLLGIFAFDNWLLNTDVRQSVYWRLGKEKRYSVTFIDNGGCFGGASWSMGSAFIPPTCEEQEFHTMIPNAELILQNWISRIGSVSLQTVKSIAAEIPSVWYDSDSASLGSLIDHVFSRSRELGREAAGLKEYAQSLNSHELLGRKTFGWSGLANGERFRASQVRAFFLNAKWSHTSSAWGSANVCHRLPSQVKQELAPAKRPPQPEHFPRPANVRLAP